MLLESVILLFQAAHIRLKAFTVLVQLADSLLQLRQCLILLFCIKGQIPNLLLTMIKFLLQTIAFCLNCVVVISEGGVVRQPYIILIKSLLEGLDLLFKRFVALAKVT